LIRTENLELIWVKLRNLSKFNRAYQFSMMQITEAISIPLSCPKCESEMIAVKYSDPSQIYDEHNVHVCKKCDYQIPIDDFKKELFTV